MLRSLLNVPKESRVMVVVSLTVLLQVLLLSAFGLAALKGQAAEGEKNMRDVCQRVLDRNLAEEVTSRIDRAARDAEEAVSGLRIEVPGTDFALGPAIRNAMPPDGLLRRAFILDAGGSWFDADQEPVWPAPGRRAPPAGGDSVALFEDLEDAAEDAGSLSASIAETRTLIEKADGSAKPLGLMVLARLLERAGRPDEAVAEYDRVCREFPAALDSLGVPLGPAASGRRIELRASALERAGNEAEGALLAEGLLEHRRLLILARHRMDRPRHQWELDRVRDGVADLAEVLTDTQMEHLTRELSRLDRDEEAFLTMRRVFGESLAATARGDRPAGRLVEMLPDGPRVVQAVPLVTDSGETSGVVAFELSLSRIRKIVLPDILEGLPLPDGVGASVLDAEGRPVVSGLAPPAGRPFLATGRFGEGLGFWRPVVFLRDQSLLERRTESARRLHYAVMALSIAGMLAGGWFVLRTVRRELKVAKLKSDFLSTVTHELKTPLTSIRMFVETLQEGRVKDEGERRECLGVISREAERLSGLIQRVLDLARFEGKKKGVVSRRATDIGELVRESVEIFRLRLGESEAKVEVEVGPGLEEVSVEPGAVQEVLLNLLGNAQKYGGRNIRVAAKASNGSALLSVEDDGMGIEEAEQSRIFEKFYRANESLARDVEGSGLGLALVREIVRAHGGRVAVKSKKGEGSRFTVSLPLTEGR